MLILLITSLGWWTYDPRRSTSMQFGLTKLDFDLRLRLKPFKQTYDPCDHTWCACQCLCRWGFFALELQDYELHTFWVCFRQWGSVNSIEWFGFFNCVVKELFPKDPGKIWEVYCVCAMLHPLAYPRKTKQLIGSLKQVSDVDSNNLERRFLLIFLVPASKNYWWKKTSINAVLSFWIAVLSAKFLCRRAFKYSLQPAVAEKICQSSVQFLSTQIRNGRSTSKAK